MILPCDLQWHLAFASASQLLAVATAGDGRLSFFCAADLAPEGSLIQ
jgi:hypothetical protein